MTDELEIPNPAAATVALGIAAKALREIAEADAIQIGNAYRRHARAALDKIAALVPAAAKE